MSTKPMSPVQQAASLLADYSRHDWLPIMNMTEAELATMTAEILECVSVVHAVAEHVVSLNDERMNFRTDRNNSLRKLICMAPDYQSR